MHLCGQCAIITLIFGLVFILNSVKVISIDNWLIVGVYLGLLGLYNMLMKK